MQIVGTVILIIGVGCGILEDIAVTKRWHTVFTDEAWILIKWIKWMGCLLGFLLLLSS